MEILAQDQWFQTKTDWPVNRDDINPVFKLRVPVAIFNVLRIGSLCIFLAPAFKNQEHLVNSSKAYASPLEHKTK